MDIILIIGFVVALALGVFFGVYIGKLLARLKFKDEISKHRKDAVTRSRSILSGLVSEQLAPYLPGFNYNPSECKFIGKPVDFIVFKGLDDKENPKVDEIIFVEVKSGNSKLTRFEKLVKEAVESGRVRFEEYRI